MPVQVPPGHVVQQIVDESGTLRHVILSPQPPIVPMPPAHYVSINFIHLHLSQLVSGQTRGGDTYWNEFIRKIRFLGHNRRFVCTRLFFGRDDYVGCNSIVQWKIRYFLEAHRPRLAQFSLSSFVVQAKADDPYK